MKLGIPRLGIYSAYIRQFFEGLGLKVIMCPKVTPDIIKLGVMQSSDMICFPFKTTLGQQVWALEHGATDLLMFDTCGLCRFKHYHQLQEHTLKQMGYTFAMHAVTLTNFLPKLMEITGASLGQLIEAMLLIPTQMEEIEERTYNVNGNSSLRVGIVGELYTILEGDINFDIVRRLQKMGVAVHLSLTLSEFIKKALYLDYFDKREEKKEAKELLSQELGGHGFHSIYNTIHYAKLGFDGVIHLLPLSCFPAGTIINGDKLRKIEEVKKGDMVITHQRRLKRVTDTMSRHYVGELVSIEYMEYPEPGHRAIPLRLTPEHPIWAAKRQSSSETNFIPARELSTGDFVVTTLSYKHSQNIGRDVYLTPIQVVTREAFDGEVYNLEVEKDNSYSAQNVTVHNCMPESTTECLVDYVADKYGIPLYRFALDESAFEVGFSTRIETFCSMLKRRKEKPTLLF